MTSYKCTENATDAPQAAFHAQVLMFLMWEAPAATEQSGGST